MRHKTKKLFQQTSLRILFCPLLRYLTKRFLHFLHICLSLRMLLKVATVNDTSWQVRFVYIVFGYNFNVSKNVPHSSAVKFL